MNNKISVNLGVTNQIEAQKGKVSLLAFSTILLWASAFPVTKQALSHFSPYALGFLRCFIASIFLIVIGIFKHIRIPQKKDLPLFFVSGGMGFALYSIAFNTGLRTLTSATAAVIIATIPIMSAVGYSRLFGEKIKRIGWFSIAVAFIGVLILILWNGVFSINHGIIWILIAAISSSVYNIINRKISVSGYSALETVTYSMICGTLLLGIFLPQAVSQIVTAESKHVLSIIFLGLVPSAIANLIWGKAISLAEKTSEVTNFIFAQPLLSSILGFVFLKEIPSLGTYIGGAMILFSLVLFSLKGK